MATGRIPGRRLRSTSRTGQSGLAYGRDAGRSFRRSGYRSFTASHSVDGTAESRGDRVRLQYIAALLGRGDTVIDAGRSYYKDTLRRALVFSRFQYWLIDVGVCGAWPLTDGCCLAIGGDRSTVERLSGIFDALGASGAQSWGWIGQEGAGHFARMLHHAMKLGYGAGGRRGFHDPWP